MIAQARGVARRAPCKDFRMSLWRPRHCHVVAAEPARLGGRSAGHSRDEESWLAEERVDGEESAVAAPEDADALAVHVGQRLHVRDARLQIVEIAAAPVAEELLAELAAVAGAAAHVDLDNDVAALDEKLLEQTVQRPIRPVIANRVDVD